MKNIVTVQQNGVLMGIKIYIIHINSTVSQRCITLPLRLSKDYNLRLVQNLLSSSLLSKNIKIKMHRTIMLLVVLYGCETWSLTLREERRLRVLENMVPKIIFGPKKDEVTEE